ncbi:MAG: cytochrome d ubiquinol oxidase subunit II [Gaiellaceae bacterium]
MHLYELPLLFALIGVALYAVLAGADFGAGWWQLTAGTGSDADSIRDHAHKAMGPVWEANHVWLIFVLTVVWTAYPVAFGSIASTLSIPLFIAAVGIIFRGTAYALRAGASTARELRAIDTVFALSSILTPFALGAAVGGIASLRVPVGNAAGDEFSSWLNPTSLVIGVLAVATAAYLAAVFLCADAARIGDATLEHRFRMRALVAGLVSGAIALGGLAVLRSDAHLVYHRLVEGRGLIGLLASIAAGIATLALVWRKRYEASRYTAALAVAAIIAGWALAQSPVFLEGLTVREAAAGRNTLVAVVVAVLAGAAILFPSLALLFRLLLGGALGGGESASGRPTQVRSVFAALAPGLLPRLAIACLVAGVGFLTIADAAWAHGVGVVCLFSFIVVAFPAALPPDVLPAPQEPQRTENEPAMKEPR